MTLQKWQQFIAIAIAVLSGYPLFADFEEVSIVLEQDVSGQNFEVAFVFEGADEGLESLVVHDSSGRVILDIASEFGLREYIFESPGSRNSNDLIEYYPEGIYTVEARTVSGSNYSAQAELSYHLPAPTSLIVPLPEHEAVALDTPVVWEAVGDATKYVVEVNSDGTSGEFLMILKPPVSSINLPAGFLKPGTRYDIHIGTVSANGNRSFIVSSFTTEN